MKKATTRERQMLRIAAYQGKEEADTIKRNLISKQKQQSTSSYVQEVTKIELNNDLIITVEVGQGCYAWLRVPNTEASENNLFTFEVDYQFMEIVV